MWSRLLQTMNAADAFMVDSMLRKSSRQELFKGKPSPFTMVLKVIFRNLSCGEKKWLED